MVHGKNLVYRLPMILPLFQSGHFVRFFVGDTVKSALESIPLPSLPSSVAAAPTLKPGYYLLNREGSAESGFPRYVYIGPEQATGPPETN
jgi:hypothetical protein